MVTVWLRISPLLVPNALAVIPDHGLSAQCRSDVAGDCKGYNLDLFSPLCEPAPKYEVSWATINVESSIMPREHRE